MVIAGAICKNISKKLELSQFFRYWFGFSIAVIILASAMAQLLHIYPVGDVRLCSRFLRFLIRTLCALTIFALTFIPVSLFGEPGWIAVIATIVTLFTFAEWVGRTKKGSEDDLDVGQGEHHVPLLGHVIEKDVAE